jgi:hypothetical protein
MRLRGGRIYTGSRTESTIVSIGLQQEFAREEMRGAVVMISSLSAGSAASEA